MNVPQVPIEYRPYTTVIWLVCGILTLRHALKQPQIKAEPTLGWVIAGFGLMLGFPVYWLMLGLQHVIIWWYRRKQERV